MPPKTDQTFRIKEGDTAPSIVEELFNADGSPMVLGTSTVFFHLMDVNGNVVVNQQGSAVPVGVDNPLGNQAQYDWQAGDTDRRGEFLREWEVHRSTGGIVTVPDGQVGYPVIITPQIA